MKQKGFAGVILLIFIALILLFGLGYFFVAKPYKVAGSEVVFPFKPGEQLLSEKITYLFQKPQVGDRVIFLPQDNFPDYVGIITKIENENNVTSYTIISTGKGQPWIISADKIRGKIYFPFLNQEELVKIALFLAPTLTPTPAQNSDETVNWKTYKNIELKYEFKYPSNWEEAQYDDGVNPKLASGIKHQNDGELWIVIMGYLTEEELSRMGASACAVLKDENRCESRQLNEDITAMIDWGLKEWNYAFVSIRDPKGGEVTFTLKPVIPETKNILNQILSTFKFNP
ncbi:MAG: S26 family signal peptidase [Candidatus Daviesbacteria bacterium]